MGTISNNEIKRIKSLSHKKFRDETGLFVVEGEKLVREALDSGYEVIRVWRRDEIGEDAMSRISLLSSPSPVLAVVRIPEQAGKSVSPGVPDVPDSGILLALDTIHDPGNLGTIIRTADWFGIRDVFATFETVDVYNPKVVQATMGAIFRVKVHYCSLPEVERVVLEHGGRVYGTFLDGENLYKKLIDTGENHPVMLLIGNEADGISPEVGALVTDRLLIPACGNGSKGSESLNAACAAAIVMAEFRRRTFTQA